MTPDPQPGDMLPDYSWVRDYPPYRRTSAPATIAIVASTAAVFIVQLWFYFFLESYRLDRFMAFSPDSFAEGHYWQFLTYAWIHSETMPIHILVNMLMVLVLGMELERILGSLRFLVIYICGAIGAALAFWAASTNPLQEVAGASGSAFALLAAFAVICPRRRMDVLLFLVIPMRLKVLTLAITACAIEVVCQIIAWFPEWFPAWLYDWTAFISHSAHLGGALTGALLAWIFKPRVELPRPAIFTSGFFSPPPL